MMSVERARADTRRAARLGLIVAHLSVVSACGGDALSAPSAPAHRSTAAAEIDMYPYSGPAADHTCAVGAATSRMYCWGRNQGEQLGDGTSSNRGAPTAVLGSTTFSPGTTNQPALGATHTCATSGPPHSPVLAPLYCWGQNAFGQLGIGSYNSQPSPVATGTASEWASVTAGGHHTCGVIGTPPVPQADIQRVFCWGRNTNGQLGIGYDLETKLSLLPLRAAPSTFVSRVGAGEAFTCALFDEGVPAARRLIPYCWGDNSFGQLGIGVTDARYSPTRVSVPTGVVGFANLTVGLRHACVLADRGTLSFAQLYCWGDNSHGQLGTGDRQPRYVMALVTFPGGRLPDYATAGGAHTCGQTNDGTYCWGRNQAGQVGNQPTLTGADVLTPALVVTSVTQFLDFHIVSAGLNHTCGHGFDNKPYCWGDNSYGQLGIGTIGGYATEPRLVAVP